MRKARKAETIGFSVVGTLMVFLAITLPTFTSSLTYQLPFALVGLFLVQAGIWRMTERTLRNERRFLALRGEVEGFLGLVRTLNAQGARLREEGTEERERAFRESIRALHSCVDRIVDVAGREG